MFPFILFLQYLILLPSTKPIILITVIPSYADRHLRLLNRAPKAGALHSGIPHYPTYDLSIAL